MTVQSLTIKRMWKTIIIYVYKFIFVLRMCAITHSTQIDRQSQTNNDTNFNLSHDGLLPC